MIDFRLFRGFTSGRVRSQIRLLSLSLLVGLLAGLAAILIYVLCQVVAHYALGELAGYNPDPPGGEAHLLPPVGVSFRPLVLLLVISVGGLLSGAIVYFFAPEAEGHGTDAAIAAFHHGKGEIRPQVPAVKLAASAVTIGTGGSGGLEGPIAQIGAGIGSAVGGVFRLRPVERRVLLAAGIGAGVAAIFRAPIAGALFAGEVLYRSIDFEAEVIIPAALASVTAYCTFASVVGWTPIFTLPPELVRSLTFQNPLQLLPYSVLAIYVAALALLYTWSFERSGEVFRQLRIPAWLKPAVGALCTGVVGLSLFYLFGQDKRVLSVLSVGYGIIQEALTFSPEEPNKLQFAGLLAAVALGKILTTGLTIGSGGSAGVFAPSIIIGGCGSGALGLLLHRIWPEVSPHPASFIVVGLAGFFAATAKTPVSTVVMVSEITGEYNLLLPTLWVCVIAFLVSGERTIYRSQVQSRSVSPAHQGDYVRAAIAGLHVGQFVRPVWEIPALKASDPVSTVLEKLGSVDYQALPVTDRQGAYLGMVSLDQVLIASLSPPLMPLVLAADLARGDVPVLRPEDSLDRALELFAESNLLVLAVVNGDSGQRLVGVVRRADISLAYLRRVHGTERRQASFAEH
jgi:CIC family chloride channel protein